jgi:transposase InsO family protein
MNSHKNALSTQLGRQHLVSEAQRIGVVQAAAQAGMSRRTVHKWAVRAQAGHSLADRSSRPLRSPRRSAADKVERVQALRQNHRLTYAAIAERVGMSKSTVGRICKAADLARLPPLDAKPPGPRYERKHPGELLHIDTKKLSRFSQPGHRVTADRTKKTRNAGHQALHVCIDDHSRVGFSQMLADETAKSACDFLLAALRYYRQLGVKVQAVMTDNGAAYRSKRFAKLMRRLKLRHLRTRPYTPRTNGKAERFIQTLLREWAYAYRYPNSDARAAELEPWMHHYNWRRPHSATEHRPPASRLGAKGNNVSGNYT